MRVLEQDRLDLLIEMAAGLQLYINTNGGKQQNPDFFDDFIETRDAILENFGLPDIEEFKKLINFDKEPSSSDKERLIDVLGKASVKYKLSSSYYEADILKEASHSFKDINKVFSELEITPHPYTFFIYREILHKNIDTPVAALESIRIADESNILEMLGKLALAEIPSDEKEQLLRFLISIGVKYLDEYLQAYNNNPIDDPGSQVALAKFWYNLKGQIKHDSLEERFKTIANYLMNHLFLVVNNHSFRIIECEFYYHDQERHPDPYVHMAGEQLDFGTWYYNGMGLDITFGDLERRIYGGILIRGVKKMGKNPVYISGPSNVLKYIFTCLGNVLKSGTGIYLQELLSKPENISEPIQSSRIGLKKKDDDKQNFIDKPYRFIVEMNVDHKFKDKGRVITELLSSEKINREKAHEILGYKMKDWNS